MKAIIMAAGMGTRISDLSEGQPKCLLKYNNDSMIRRLVEQLELYSFGSIIIVVGYKDELIRNELSDYDVNFIFNDMYVQDTNIYSMKLALGEIYLEPEDTYIFEADMLFENGVLDLVLSNDFDSKSVWYTKGQFNKQQIGGILENDNNGNIRDIKIVKKYEEKYSHYKKLTGIMKVKSDHVKPFYNLICQYAKERIDQYYLIPWIENLNQLPSIVGTLDNYKFATFNTPDDYKKASEVDYNTRVNAFKVEIGKVSELIAIEEHDRNRLETVKEKVIQNNVWTEPIFIEKNHNLVLDGHHRFQIAKDLNLEYIPVIKFNYESLDIWSLRDNIDFTKDEVVKNAKAGNIYPFKTVKHKFPISKQKCGYPISYLLGDFKKNISSFWSEQEKQLLRDDSQTVWSNLSKSGNEKQEIEMKKVFSYFDDLKDKDILDLGCGNGYCAFQFAREAKSVVGIDSSKNYIDSCIQKAKSKKISNVDFVVESAIDYEATTKFDLIFISGLLIYLDDFDFEELLKKIRSYSKVGTRLTLRDGTSIKSHKYFIDNSYSNKLDTHYSAIYRTSTDYIDKFAQIGFKCVEHSDMFPQDSEFNEFIETRLRLYNFIKE